MNERLPALILSGTTGPKVGFDIRFDVDGGAADAACKHLEELISIFVAAAAHGGFAPVNVPPSQSKLFVVSGKPNRSDMLSYVVAADSVDLRSFQFLRSMAARLDRHGLRVRRVTVIESGYKEQGLSEAPEPTESNEDKVYPEISSRSQVRVPREFLGFSKARRCLVELHQPVAASHVLGMADWIKPWYLLLEKGAFSMPVGFPDETDCIRGAVTLFDDLTVEISVDRFLATEAAWNVLVNMVDAYGNLSAPVARVIIE